MKYIPLQRRKRHEFFEDTPHLLLGAGEGGVVAGIFAIGFAARLGDKPGCPFVAAVFIQSDDGLEVKAVAIDAAKSAAFGHFLPFGPVERCRLFHSVLL